MFSLLESPKHCAEESLRRNFQIIIYDINIVIAREKTLETSEEFHKFNKQSNCKQKY